MSLLSVQNISKSFKHGFQLEAISFSQAAFQKIGIAGETGSGKSTLLKVIAGFLQADSGKVLMQDQPIKGPDEQLLPGHPRIAYLSQHYELRNHYRVEEFLEFRNKFSEDDAATIFEICRISHLLKRKTSELSGGERQRVALAQLLTAAPKLLLLDEPFSNLDLSNKLQLKEVLKDLGTHMEITFILASHDPLDLLGWADRLLIMKEGRIVQEGLPMDLYLKPESDYAAGLLGPFNKLPVQVIQHSLPWKDGLSGTNAIIRPESFRIKRTGDGISLPGTIKDIIFAGSRYEILVQLAKHSVLVYSELTQHRVGEIVYVSLKPGCVISVQKD